MPDLLLELRSEEIPARMQRKAAGDLRKLVTDALVDAGLTYEAAREYWTPRRLALDLRGLTAKSADLREERKGPRADAPQKAIEGFLRGAGLTSIEEAEIRSDPKKGDFYVAVVEKPGRRAEEIIASVMPEIIRGFPWPKSMRWGAASGASGVAYGGVEGRGPESLRWVRPLQSIVCTFGPETEEPVVIPFSVDGIASGNVTYGQRFHAPGAITVRRFDDYADKLDKAYVVIDPERRRHMIEDDAANLAFASGLEVVADDGLLDEVSGLVEWPVTLIGEFDEAFLSIPDEVIRLTIRANQKCFVTRTMSGQLSSKFVLVANIEASDGGAEIARGNGKVVRARLSDAAYFWETDQSDLPDLAALKSSAEKFGLDLKKPLDQRMAKLDYLGVTFHAKLGTQGERVERIRRLAGELAPTIAPSISPLAGEMPGRAEGGNASSNANSASSAGAAIPPSVASGDISPARGEIGAEDLARLADRAAVLAKADLTTEVVGEFPELQGLIGRKYAGLQGEHPSVAAAIEEHYKPLGPSDTVPSDPVSVAVALADKLDTLVGFWAIDEKPTGSKDPYALRRAALGVIRIVVENGVRLPLARSGVGSDLLAFFHDRLKVYLRDKGARHDLIDAVLAAGFHLPLDGGGRGEAAGGGEAAGSEQAVPPTPARRADPPHMGEGERGAVTNDDLLAIVRRVEALSELLGTETGQNLLAGTKRAANILAAEEKKGTRVAPTVIADAFTEAAEEKLYVAVNQVESEALQAIQNEDYSGAMTALAKLREPVDSFFEDVLVNDDDDDIRANRLALLSRVRAATLAVADFSRIAG